MGKSEMLASFLLRVITSGEAGGRNCPKVAKDEGRRRKEGGIENRTARSESWRTGICWASGVRAVRRV